MNAVVADVVLGALVEEGRVLLVHRSPHKRAHPDVWDLPGGCVEDGESEVDTLERELREELGVRISRDAVSHLYRLTAGPADEPALVSAWMVSRWQGVPANIAPDEHVGIGWFALDDLPSPAHPVMRNALLNALRGTAADPSYNRSRPRLSVTSSRR
ncbi:NUDIX hydrolase [Flexivirga caeni]|uniref:NUDIX hydrolase n=1 Tax=Flexivirga caeni TaxID=2294115 RepID=UPI001FE4F452|nr:NUDIX domain-containing protein [Flexivirga caeni]